MIAAAIIACLTRTTCWSWMKAVVPLIAEAEQIKTLARSREIAFSQTMPI